MKKIALALALPFAFFSTLALAAPFSIDELQAVTKLATEDFVAANAAHAPHFTGFKSWLSGDEARVKIYVNHNGSPMEFNYECHKHDDELECHRQ